MGDTGVEQDDLRVCEGGDLGSKSYLVQGSKASTLMLEFGKLWFLSGQLLMGLLVRLDDVVEPAEENEASNGKEELVESRDGIAVKF